MEALASVESAGYADGLPDDPAGFAYGGAGEADGVRLAVRRISPGLLRTLQIPVIRGRGLLDSDRASGESVGLVDRTFAERAAEDPLGRLVPAGSERVRVVGIAGEVMAFPARNQWSTLYLPFWDEPEALAQRVRALFPDKVEVVARFRGGASADALATLAAIPKTVDSSLRVLRAEALRRRRTGMLGAAALASVVLVVFAAGGLLLTLVGVVGHILSTAAREAQPNAVRLALGADPVMMVWQVARRTATAAAAGIGVGLAVGWLLAQGIRSRVAWVETEDPLLYLGPASLVALLMAAGGLYAGLKAARTAPWALLRSL